MPSLEVRLLDAQAEPAWDAFVRAHPMGGPFHLPAWKRAIEESFGYRPYCLAAYGADGLRAVLPLFLVKNFLMGRVLLSTPFAVYGGILAVRGDDTSSPSSASPAPASIASPWAA